MALRFLNLKAVLLCYTFTGRGSRWIQSAALIITMTTLKCRNVWRIIGEESNRTSRTAMFAYLRQKHSDNRVDGSANSLQSHRLQASQQRYGQDRTIRKTNPFLTQRNAGYGANTDASSTRTLSGFGQLPEPSVETLAIGCCLSDQPGAERQCFWSGRLDEIAVFKTPVC